MPSSLELSDTKVYEPSIRALLRTTSHFCEVLVLELRTVKLINFTLNVKLINLTRTGAVFLGASGHGGQLSEGEVIFPDRGILGNTEIPRSGTAPHPPPQELSRPRYFGAALQKVDQLYRDTSPMRNASPAGP
jgi:hypothetical protein